MNLAQQLKSMRACPDAVEWVGRRGLRTAWRDCKRGDWMLWLAGRLDIDRKLLVLAACDCAETALQYVPDGEDRPAAAIQTARDWCAGTATKQDCRDAAYAANAAYAAANAAYAAANAAVYAANAAYAAAYAAANAAVYAAANAAYAANAAANAAVYAAVYAAANAAYAANAAANAAVYAAANAANAGLVRQRIPFATIGAAMKLKFEDKAGDTV